ncbi:MAG: hypothetical protein JSW26_09115 [Desulfobacterales bacterium]|nr:MAG: hypothetical protein JSW26_09115 [Desulfobacterales bacterium]
MPSSLKISIGAITTAVEWQSAEVEIVVPQAYQPFISDSRADLHLTLHLGAPQLVLGEKFFDSPPIWQSYRNGNASVIKIFDSYSDLQRLLVLPTQPERANLYFAEPDGQFIDPFFGPTMELLMINYLARGHGVIIHACGIDFNGKGMLFAGESGAGKSTLANLWDRVKGAAVLSDDRTLVRQINGEMRMFGTPWHGEAKFGSPRGVKLEAIFFLSHAQQNALRQTTAAESVTRMLKCSFPPLWDRAGMEFTMGLFEKLATRVCCHELAFRPDESVIQFVEALAR